MPNQLLLPPCSHLKLQEVWFVNQPLKYWYCLSCGDLLLWESYSKPQATLDDMNKITLDYLERLWK
jgi:hypothetical protein